MPPTKEWATNLLALLEERAETCEREEVRRYYRETVEKFREQYGGIIIAGPARRGR